MMKVCSIAQFISGFWDGYLKLEKNANNLSNLI